MAVEGVGDVVEVAYLAVVVTGIEEAEGLVADTVIHIAASVPSLSTICPWPFGNRGISSTPYAAGLDVDRKGN